jgi:hypothetical protein
MMAFVGWVSGPTSRFWEGLSPEHAVEGRADVLYSPFPHDRFCGTGLETYRFNWVRPRRECQSSDEVLALTAWLCGARIARTPRPSRTGCCAPSRRRRRREAAAAAAWRWGGACRLGELGVSILEAVHFD